MRKKNFFLILVLILGLCVSVSLASAQEATGEPIRVGAIFDLSGATADVGTPYSEGVLAYVDYINNNGGIEGRPIELISQDYAYDPAIAETLYNQFVEEGVVVFMGWGTGDTLALKERITEDELPFVSASYSSDLNDPQDTAPYNFLVATTYSDQLVIMVRTMAMQWEAAGNAVADMRVAFLHNDSPFGLDPLDEGEAEAEALGIGGTLRVPMPRGATDFTAELQQADDFGVTHIVIQNVSGPAALLARNVADFFGMGEIVVGCLNWCADELFVTQAGEAAEGTLGALPFTATTVEVPGQELPTQWLTENDTRTLQEAGLHFTQGWAAMDILAEGLRRTIQAGQELTGPNIRANLETLENYETGGLLAPVTFTAEDHRGNRALSIYTVSGGVWGNPTEAIDLRAEEMAAGGGDAEAEPTEDSGEAAPAETEEPAATATP